MIFMKYKHIVLAIFITFFGFVNITNASILNESFIKLLNTKSMSFGTRLNYAFKEGILGNGSEDKGYIDISSISKQDISIPGAIKLDQSLSFKGKNSEMSFNITLKAMMFGDTFYLLIPDAPFDEFIPDLVPYKGQWIRLSRADVEIIAQNNPEAKESYQRLVEANNKPDLLVSNLTDIIKKYSPAFEMKKTGSRTVSGEKQDKYIMSLNNTKLLSIITIDFRKKYKNISTKEKTQLTKDFKKMLSVVRFKNGVLYVGQKDKLPRELSFTVEQLNEKKKVKSTLKFNFTFADFGSHFEEVVAPSQFISSADLYVNVFKPKLEAAKAKAEQVNLKANLASFRPQAEIIYDSLDNKYGTQSNTGSCTNPTIGSIFNKPMAGNSSDSERYNEYIQSTMTEVLKVVGNETRCYSNTASYAFQASYKDNSGYFCVDSTGIAKNTTKLITSPICGD